MFLLSSYFVKKLCSKLSLVFFVFILGRMHSSFDSTTNSDSVLNLLFFRRFVRSTEYMFLSKGIIDFLLLLIGEYPPLVENPSFMDYLSSYRIYFKDFFVSSSNKSSLRTNSSIFFLFSSYSLSSLAESYSYPSFMASAYFTFS